MFATNMSGKFARLRSDRAASFRDWTARLDFPPAGMVTGAQFMYISLLPMRLNQVHAIVYSPGATPSGILKVYLLALLPLGSGVRLPAVALLGQPPTMEWMTKNLELLVGALSEEREIWHDPPPWTAEPLNARVCIEPMGHELETPLAL